ncbi:MAG: MFS transporter [Acidobacteria bacterium]|nr:MFS transporter [Acidobacteriota bacterium]
MKRTWALVGLLSATATAAYLCRVNITVAGAMMMRELGLSQEAMGRVFSAFLLGYALCQIPGGMLADRFGARRVLAWASLVWAAATVLAAGAGAAMPLLLASRFLLGVAEAPMFPGAARAIAAWTGPQERGRANGAVIAAIGLGSAIAPPLVSFVMVRSGWRAALVVTAIPAVLAGLTWMAVRTPPETAPAVAEARGNGAPRTRAFALLTLSYTLQGYVGYIFVFWFYLYLVEVRHFDLLRGALMGSLPWLLSIVSIPLGGWAFDRLGARRKAVPVAGLVGSGVLIAAGAHAANAWLAAACLALATGLVLSVEGPFWAAMTSISGPRSGAAGGAMNMGSNLGGLISPALTPIVARLMGWEAALLISAFLAVIAGALWFWIPSTLEPSRSVA